MEMIKKLRDLPLGTRIYVPHGDFHAKIIGTRTEKRVYVEETGTEHEITDARNDETMFFAIDDNNSAIEIPSEDDEELEALPPLPIVAELAEVIEHGIDRGDTMEDIAWAVLQLIRTKSLDDLI
jgi:hypothetical protein